MQGKKLTGYHIMIFSFTFLLLHFPFVFVEVEWNWQRELQTLAAYILFGIGADFSWFIWNPHYGRGRFKPESIEWHKSWTLGIPTDYWIGMIVAIILTVIAGALKAWINMALIFSGLIIVSCLIAAYWKPGLAY